MIKPINHDLTFLAQKAHPATTADRQIITDLLDTLAAHHDDCVGMAANMIGINKRIIVVQMGPFAVPLVNPRITHRANPHSVTEGCLSISGQKTTTRYQSITVSYLDRQFQPQQQTFTDWIAQIIQHELDHCEGILI